MLDPWSIFLDDSLCRENFLLSRRKQYFLDTNVLEFEFFRFGKILAFIGSSPHYDG